MHRLITIPFSHYNERARWGLDVCAVPYRERPYLPGLHVLPVAWATKLRGRADAVSSPLSTPLLVTDDGDVLQDSGAILRFADAHRARGTPTLFPSTDAADLSDRYHDELGPHSRRVAYHHLFTDLDAIRAAAERCVGPIQATLFWLLRHQVRAGITRSLNVTDDAAARSLKRVEALFEETSRRLEDRAYLAGDTFSAADLSFAALASPVLLPSPDEGFGNPGIPPLDDVPAPWASLARALRATPAGAHAMRVYRDHRR